VPLTDDALTLAVLREIRDELVSLGGRVDDTRRELSSGIDVTNSRLSHVESAVLELAQQQTFVVRWIKAGSRRERRLETDLLKLEKRVDAIEARLPDAEE
jgi:cob(I)alamin adenosyltransferase